MKLFPLYIFILIICCVVVSSCKKDSFITDPGANLYVNRDSIKFDTVFTSVGSVTQSFKVFNQNDQKLRISTIKLMGGINSPFKININGVSAPELTDITIAANDSIYVFVSVTINPSAANLPFVVSDSILIDYNGNSKFVQLESYGQNANYLNGSIIAGQTTWTDELPYVILGSLQIDTTATLTIEEGTKVFIHANAPILVDGTLIISGTKNNEVIFRGDRLDAYYRDLPGGWQGIYFRKLSKNNDIRFAKILNATEALVVQDPSTNSNPKLKVHQTVIDNAFTVGLYGSNTSIETNNTLISNCANNIYFQLGGNYLVTNCTVASYSTSYFLHQNPVLQVTDAAIVNGTINTNALNAQFTNCIFWGDYGNVDDEIVLDKQGNLFNAVFTNCIIKSTNTPANATLTAVIENIDPLFDSIDIGNKIFNFRTSNPAAPGLNSGAIIAFPFDLDANDRNVGVTDIGAYEKQ